MSVGLEHFVVPEMCDISENFTVSSTKTTTGRKEIAS